MGSESSALCNSDDERSSGVSVLFADDPAQTSIIFGVHERPELMQIYILEYPLVFGLPNSQTTNRFRTHLPIKVPHKNPEFSVSRHVLLNLVGELLHNFINQLSVFFDIALARGPNLVDIFLFRIEPIDACHRVW